MTDVLRVENLEAGYDGRMVIKGLNMVVHDGDVVAVLGPNGSGKTTFLKAILGMLPLKGGRVRLFGQPPGGPEHEARVAYIPQRMELDRTFPITLREMLNLRRHRKEMEMYIDMLEIRGLLDKKVGDLSGGQMQRALLAYALIKDPGLLIMDEPTSWVDARGANCILCIIKDLRAKGIAVLLVSHDYSAIKHISTHVLGVGHEGYFFEDAKSPGLEDKITALFGPMHHAGEADNYCTHCGVPLAQEEE